MSQTALDFSTYIDERTRDFVGREWVFAEIDRWLADPDAPQVFLLAGEPGIGKTAIAARLTQFSDGDAMPPTDYACVGDGFLSAVHFCSARNGGWISPNDFARSLSTQLATRYPAFAEALVADLQLYVEQHVETNLGTVIGAQITHYYAQSSETLFNDLVRRPLQAFSRKGEGSGPLVILVDGLDEALSFSGRISIVRLLAACNDLPSQVRLLLTSRPVDGVMEPFRSLQPFTLFAHREENQGDVRAYVRRRLETSTTLQGQAGGEAQIKHVTGSLVTRSGGNFLVISKVLDSVERGEMGLAEPEALPAALQDLYAWFLDRLIAGDMKAWRGLYRPVLGTLVVAQEPADAPTLCQWTGLTRQEVGDALHDLCEFLDPALDNRYRLYHESVVDFLTGEKAGPYYLDVAEYHQRIADYYRGEASTWDAVDWDRTDEYGKRYLVAHLHALEDIETYRQGLQALVESRAWNAAKYVDTPWVGSLVRDLQLASAAVARGDIGDWARAMGYQLRRALVESLMSRVSDRAILFLTRLGQMDRALELTRRQWNKFKLLREIARIVALTQPTKAVEILTELAHLTDDSSSALGQCKARLAAAQEILRLVPASSRIALDLVKEAKDLEQEIPASDSVEYRVTWYLPTLALSGDLDAALTVSEGLPLFQRSRALRHISSVLPEGHPSRKDLAEQALSMLETLEQTPQILSERTRAIVALLPLVDEGEQRQLLHLLESVGASLRSVEAPGEYAVMPHWAIGRVAAIDLGWARRMLLEPNWGSTPDTLYQVAREIAKVNYEEALRLVRDQFSNHILTPNLLICIIGIVAAEDIGKAEALIEEYAIQLRDDKDDAYIAIAEAYLDRGNDQKAQEIFNKHTPVPDSEGFAHARDNLQLAILVRASFLPVEVAYDRLMQFPVCPRCHQSQEKQAKVVLARMAARQNKLDILEQHRFGRGARLEAAIELADQIDPEAARRYLEDHRLTFGQGIEEVHAHIAAVDAQQNPEKLAVLLEHFDGNGKPHDFCAYMRELPYTLRKLMKARRIDPEEAAAIIERLYPLLVDWECPRRNQPPKDEFWKTRCDCYGYSEYALAQLIGVMALLDSNRSDEMVSLLPAQPVKAYALRQILHHTQAYQTQFHRITATCQECVKDPWQRAEFYYTLAISLPIEMTDMINHLIQLAEPLLNESPTEYQTNKFGMPIRIGPSPTKLKIRKAQALMKLVGNVSQFAYVTESLEAIESLIQLDDKLKVFELLAQQAVKWPAQDKLALLWRIWELSIARELTDVQAFIAFSVPLVYSLGGEKAFWWLYTYIEWAYKELPQADSQNKVNCLSQSSYFDFSAYITDRTRDFIGREWVSALSDQQPYAMCQARLKG